ncbi:hypothetical protein KNV66_gp09 [Bacillus phage DLc1]|uniref:Uncharacterized protein n=1 Tax=Bacillus phage DLc1 TaxID=2777318 RepID=A0A7M1RQ92_9CAUD|nr:hypothetical protein KNV66_gp09 [Bacillus phage DLc1]QOR56294.1 hypothetical protein [Bacillus phage DLc1]
MKLKRRTLKWLSKNYLNKKYGKLIRPKNYTHQEFILGNFTKDKNGKINGFNPSK